MDLRTIKLKKVDFFGFIPQFKYIESWVVLFIPVKELLALHWVTSVVVNLSLKLSK